MRRLTKKSKAIIGAVVVGLAGSGTAYGFWTSSGAGSGLAPTTNTTVALVVKQTSSFTAMYPGGPAQTLAGTFDNPNAFAMRVTAVTATGYTIDAGHSGCRTTDGNYTLGGTAYVGLDVPAGSAVGAWSGLTITMNNLPTNQDACKGALVTITYASS